MSITNPEKIYNRGVTQWESKNKVLLRGYFAIIVP